MDRLSGKFLSSLHLKWNIIFVLAVSVSCALSQYLQFDSSQILSESSEVINNIVLDPRTNMLYVGAVNNLFKLSGNLEKQGPEFETGPKLDSPSCFPPPNRCERNQLTNNVNKILTLDGDRLITCGSIYQGTCQVREVNTFEMLGNNTQEEIVPNMENGTAVAFVAPGPSDRNVLYVGSSRGRWIDKTVPTISSRMLPESETDRDLFKIIRDSEGIRPTAMILIPDKVKTNNQFFFDIKYVSGFAYRNFSYFVVIQPMDPDRISESDNITKLVRVCHGDENFFSYIELPLVCSHPTDGTKYNLAQAAYVAQIGSDFGSADFEVGEEVLYITFSKAMDKSVDPLEDSAVCMYSLRSINTHFFERRKNCASGQSDSTHIDWMESTLCPSNSNTQLVKAMDDAGLDYCHNLDYIRPMGGQSMDAIQGTAIFMDTSAVLTAVAATYHQSETIIFLGDNHGHLKKLSVISDTEASMYEDKAIDTGSAVIRNGLLFSRNLDYIYVTTQKKITKVPVEECNEFKTCDECLGISTGVGDSYCGWCTLQSMCTRGNNSICAGAENSTLNRWLNSDVGCINISLVTPRSLARGVDNQLLLDVENLPHPAKNENFRCKFGEIGTTSAEIEPLGVMSKVRCSSPSESFQINDGILVIELGLLYSANNNIIISTNFLFYDCEQFTGCIDCVDNDFNCDWSINDNSCAGNRGSCDSAGSVCSRLGNEGNNSFGGRDFCPQISKATSDIIIPVDITREIRVNTKNLPSQEAEFSCVLSFENKEKVTRATWISEEELVCQQAEYSYDSELQELPVQLNIRWRPTSKGSNAEYYTIDNPVEMKVTIYKCDVDRTNCGECLLADQKFECGWCQGSCSINSLCADGTKWLTGEALCWDPQIEEFYPHAGHYEGGVILTIKGINLGRTADDIQSITIDGIKCLLKRETYIRASEMKCVTERSEERRHKGVIEIEISGQTGDITQVYSGTSREKFRFTYPKITGVSPTQGPASGGTLLTITGTDLMSGSIVTAQIGSFNCTIQTLSENVTTCITSAGIGENYVGLNFDGNYEEGTATKFTYRTDPIIEKLSRYKTIKSGNLSVEVEGTNLNVAGRREIIFRFGNQTFYSSCATALSSTTMTCKTPDVSDANLLLPYDVPKSDYGFILDGVKNFTSLHLKDGFQMFEIVMDPVYYNFSEEDQLRVIKNGGGERNVIEIEGANITLAYSEGDIIVYIGKKKCDQVFPKDNLVRCDAPSGDDAGEEAYAVVVCHGNIKRTVGYVKYTTDHILPMIIIAGCAIAFLALLIIVIIFAVYRHNATENERRVKHLEQERDKLELEVAKECKEAFAELQISMNPFSSDVGTNIPFLPYQEYAIRTLFPDKFDHPVLRELSLPDGQAAHMKAGLKEFGQLIGNRTFLLTFVETLENQSSFTIQDKSNVASLLMVALQGKMDYCTDIIKVLLDRLIEKYVVEDRAKLLMRRNESIVEKMISNWLSFLLYNFLSESAGEPLFMLFYAIKQQVERGPVDMITGEARYGLSELKIIRQQIDFVTLNIYARGLDKNLDAIPVKVLDCDSISQAKEKILDALYPTIPYTHRPPKLELDLVWNCGLKGQRTLQDEDETSAQDVDGKRINTLSHYGIKDGDTISLEPKQGFTQTAFTPPSGKYATLTSAHSPSRMTQPMLNSDLDSGTKYWHLVKPTDMEDRSKGGGTSKMMAEVYLPRLLTMKGTIQKFVDDLFETIFSVNHRGNTLPQAIKYLFDIFDDKAALYSITDPGVVHSWKSNCLPLRFWVNLIKNPNLILDIYKSDTVDACLSIVGQCLMDACSYSDVKLTKDSPSSKLLYAKDIPTYKDWVNRYYRDIQTLHPVSDQDMNSLLLEHSHAHQYDFHTMSALNKLYVGYAQRYSKEIMQALDEDEFALKSQLGAQFERVEDYMNDDQVQQVTEL